MIFYVDLFIYMLYYLLNIAILLYCVDSAIKSIKKHYKKRKQ